MPAEYGLRARLGACHDTHLRFAGGLAIGCADTPRFFCDCAPQFHAHCAYACSDGGKIPYLRAIYLNVLLMKLLSFSFSKLIAACNF